MLKRMSLTALAVAATVAQGATASEMSDADQALVVEVVQQELTAWIDDPRLVDALNAQNAYGAEMTPAVIEMLENAWAGGEANSLLIHDVLARPASVVLRERREASQGVVTEIILMDRAGLNAAISDKTTDVWQGDEAKFTETVPRGPGAVFVDAPAVDASTGVLQTQVSMSVTDPATGEVIGAVCFGIDLSRAQALRAASVAAGF